MFIDYEDDKQLFEYFKIYDVSSPKIIIFNFNLSRYFVDDQVYDTEENQRKHIEALLIKIKNDEIHMVSGNFFEDFLIRLGVEINPTNMSIFFFGVVVILVLLVVSLIYCCDTGEVPEAPEVTEKEIEDKLQKEEKDKSKKESKKNK